MEERESVDHGAHQTRRQGGGAAQMRVKAEPGRLTVQGHADYGPAGQDIVCAAASALMLAPGGAVAGKKSGTGACDAAGYMHIDTQGRAEREMELVKCGLRQLQRRFPQCVEVSEEVSHFSR